MRRERRKGNERLMIKYEISKKKERREKEKWVKICGGIGGKECGCKEEK